MKPICSDDIRDAARGLGKATGRAIEDSTASWRERAETAEAEAEWQCQRHEQYVAQWQEYASKFARERDERIAKLEAVLQRVVDEHHLWLHGGEDCDGCRLRDEVEAILGEDTQ